VLINRVYSPVVFDGNPDEEAWNNNTPLNLIMHSPVYGIQPTEETDVRLTYDDNFLYVGARIYYQDPATIRSVSYKRDFIGQGGDLFGIILDTYNDKENACLFLTSPDGLRFDGNVRRDAVVSRSNSVPYDISWNAFWDVRTNRDKSGWSVEIRIPFSSLRFQEVNGEVKMGLIIQRWIAAKNEMIIFPAIPPNWGQYSYFKPSQAKEVVLKGVKPIRPTYIAPYILAGHHSKWDINNTSTDYLRSDKRSLEAGLDVKYGISSNLIMDLTINTDFAQVEVDDQKINLSRFSLFFPEKRTFFLERASIFDFSLGGNNNLFYSRRIGLSKEGDPVRIYGGARITGRMGKWEIGVIDLQTAPLTKSSSDGNIERIVPSENFGVLRLRRRILNDNSYIGTMLTSRLGTDGSYNLAYGLDAILRVYGDEYINIVASQSNEDDIAIYSFTKPSRLLTEWERRSDKGIGYSFGYSYSGTDYNPGIGFERMHGYSYFKGDLKYGWIPDESSQLYRHSPEIRFRYWTYVEDGSLMTIENTAGWSFQTRNNWTGELRIGYLIENLKDTLFVRKDEVCVVPGRYEFVNFAGTLNTPVSKQFYISLGTETGQFYDGSRISINLAPVWNISKHLEIGSTYNFDHVNFMNRNQEMTNHIVGIKSLFMIDIKFSINAYIQYNTSNQGIVMNLRLRYNPKEGNDLYLVYNEDSNTDLLREVPVLPARNSRAVLLKYTYTFNL
jgi:hypothetical protein